MEIWAGNPLQHVFVIMRCCRWRDYVRWEATRRFGGHPGPMRVRSWWFMWLRNVHRTGLSGREACPVDITEALETARCVKALRPHLRMALVEEYLVGGTEHEKARALEIPPRTFRHRRSVAHVELLDKFNAAGAGLEIEDLVEQPRRGRPPVLRVAAA